MYVSFVAMVESGNKASNKTAPHSFQCNENMGGFYPESNYKNIIWSR